MRKRCKYFLLLTIQFAVCIQSYAQAKPQLRFFHIGIQQGLSHNTVNCLLQDKTGFIWVGTDNGLNRYDGYQFVLVGAGNDKNTIASQQIASLAEDKNGMIWIGTKTAGLHKYDPKTGSILHFKNSENSKILSDNFVRKICADNNGILWLGTPNGLTYFNTKTYQTKIFKNIPGNKYSLVDNDIRAFCISKKTNGIWIGTYNNSLCYLNLTTEKFKCYPYPGWEGYHPESPNTRAVSALYEDDENRLWMGGYGKDLLEYLNTATEKFMGYNSRRFVTSTTNVFIEDDIGRFWAGGWEGLTLFDKHINLLGAYYPDKSDAFSLSNRFISCMIKDRNGLIWLGTNGGGLNYFYPFSENFSVFSHNANDPHSLSSNLIKSIFKDEAGRMWIGTRYGLDTGRLETGMFKLFQQLSAAVVREPVSSIFLKEIIINNKVYNKTITGNKYLVNQNNGSINIPVSDKNVPFPRKNEFITSCIVDKMKNIWVGDFGSGLYRIDYAKGDLIYFANYSERYPKYFKSQVSYSSITDILEDKKGNVWLGTEMGLDMYDQTTGMFTSYKFDNKDTAFTTNSQNNNYIEKIKEDKDGNIWIGTNKAGVWMLDVKTKTFTQYKVPGKNDNSPFSHIISLCIAKTGIVYAGTESGGMIMINPENKNVKTITTNDGLPDNSIAGILEDSVGHLWISTYHGLCEFAPASLKIIRIFTKNDGLPSDEFAKGAYYKDAEGRMYFGNTGGLVSFVPEQLKQKTFDVPLVITDMQLFNRSVKPGDATGILSESITTTKAIKLNYDENIITLNFAALGFINTNTIKYTYRLVGFNDEWFAIQPFERSVTYTNLQPGSYVFEVKATAGLDEGKVTSLEINVSPPFWETLWFRALVVAIISITIYLFFTWRLRNAIKETRKKNEIDQKISELSLTALRSQMNPHFIFNSLNSIQHYIHSNQRESAENFLSTFATLIRQILDNSANSVIPLSEELYTIELYLKLEKARFGNRLTYKINVEDDVDTENTLVPSMLIQPYIENAILHGLTPKEEGGGIVIQIKKEFYSIICVVTDDGIGREKAIEIKNRRKINKKSYGLSITQSRLEILNKKLDVAVSVKIIDLQDEQNNACGTQVEIYMPLEERF